MAKSKGRLLAELLASDGKVKESKSALDISGGKLAPSDIPVLPNSKLENSSISIAGHNTALGGSVTLNTGDIDEHTNYKYYTEARVRSAISASGDLSYNSTTGVISFSASASPVISVNSETGSVVLDTGDIAENGNLYHTTARARASISATGSLSYNSTTGVMSFTMPAQNTSNITEGTNLYHTTARARAAISVSGNALSYNSSTGVITSNFEESPTFTGTLTTRNITMDIPDDGGAPAMSATLMIKGFEGRGAGIKIRDSVNSASSANNREWFIGSGYGQSGFNIGYASDGSQSSYTAQNKFSISTAGHSSFAGNITATGNISAPIYYDSDNSAYYIDPLSGSVLNNLDMRGTGTKLPAHAYSNTHDGTNVWWHVGTAAGSTNKVLNLRVYKSDNTNYTTHKFTTTGIEVAEALKIGTTTVIDSSRNITANTRLTFDYNDHYLEAGTGTVTFKSDSNASLITLGQASTFNGTIRVNSNVSGIGDIDFGKAITGHNSSSPARITASSTGQLYIDSTNGQHIFLGWYNGSGYDILSEMNARFASYKDRNDTAYYMNPAGSSLIRNLEIKGTTSDSSADALHIRNSGGATQSYFRNDGTVVIGGSQYLYVTAGGGAYFSNSIKARGGILNDQGDLLLNDTVQVAGPLVIQGNGSADRMLAFTLDGRGSAFTGSNNAFIFNGQGSSGDYLAGALYFQSRSNSVNREIGFITGTTPAKRLVVNNSGITVTGTITGDLTGSVTGTATQASNLNNHNTGNLSEGSNLYYTDARVGTYLSNNGYATQSTIVAAITDSAPSTLDTLNELAAALGDDASFSTTVTNSIATKAPIANPSLTGNTSIAGNLMMTSSTSHIELGSYLKLYAATASNTGTIAINANYGGAQTDSWTADYSGDSNAGMWLLRQSSGGSGTMQVYQKKHGTSSGSHARSTFTKTAEFNIDGYFYGRNLRSERYYSSDNTSYYTDPSETSVINKLLVNGANNNSGTADFAVNAGGSHSQLSLHGGQIQAGGTDMNWNSKLAYDGNTKLGGWDNNIYLFTSGGGSATAKNIYFQPQADGGSATTRLTIHGDNGAVIADTQMRAPIFYDSNNTVYYTNPAGQSFLSTASIGTTSATSGGYSLRTGSIQMHGAGSLDYISQLHFNDNVRFLQEGNNSYLRYKAGHSTTGGIKYYNGSNALQGYVYFDTSGFGLLSSDGSWAVRTWNSGTQIYHGTRSPVYYDSDDTAYYVDPNHTTTSAKFAGNVEHKGLTMTSGSDVDQLYTVTVSAQLTTSWQDTGINGSDLSTGTYIVQIYVDSDVPRYHYQEFYSGVMSWYNGGTNSNEVDEITLHRAGHAPNAGNVFLRTLRHPSGGDNLMLQLRATHNSTSASNYIFKFRRMI